MDMANKSTYPSKKLLAPSEGVAPIKPHYCLTRTKNCKKVPALNFLIETYKKNDLL